MKVFGEFPWSTALTWLSLIVTVVLYIWSRERIEMDAQFKTTSVLEKTDSTSNDDLKVTFRGLPVQQLSLSEVYIWNGGNRTIKAEDVAEDDPLHISVSGSCSVLRSELAAVTRGTLRARVLPDASGKSVRVEFGFLDPNDGLRVDLWHTGRADDIGFAGTVMGMPHGVRVVSRRYSVATHRPSDFSALWEVEGWLFLWVIGMVTASIPTSVYLWLQFETIAERVDLIRLVCAIVGAMAFAVWFWKIERSPVFDRYPPSLSAGSRTGI